MEGREFIVKMWKGDGENVLKAIDGQDTKPMPFTDFLSHCTACGGNIGGMLLLGIKELYPGVYDAIPDKMGRKAFECICTVLELLQVDLNK